MDPSRFDAFTRACEAILSRRLAVAALLTGIPGALAAASDAESKRKKKRKQRAQQESKNKQRRKKNNKGKGKDKKGNNPAPNPGGACYPGTNCQPGGGATNAGCDFSGSDLFRGLDVQGAILSGTNFSGADLSGADLRGVILSNACLTRVDLTNAVIDGTTVLDGAIFCHTIMPDGSVDDSACDSPTSCCPTDPSGPPPGTSPCGPSWVQQTTFGSRGNGPDQFRRATGAAISADGQTLGVVDNDLHRVAIWTKVGNGWQAQATFGGKGSGPNQFNNPRTLAIAQDGQTVWVADTWNHRISVWTKTGGTWANQTTFGRFGNGPDQFNGPYGVAASADGRTIWVTNLDSHVISVWTKAGDTWQPQTQFGSYGTGPSQFSQPSSVAVAADERTVWITDEDNRRVSVWAKNGDTWTNQTTFGKCCFEPDEFSGPSQVAVTADGQTVWVADWPNDRITSWTKTSVGWRLQATQGSRLYHRDIFNAPRGIAVAPDGQTIWVADTDNYRISVWTKTGGNWHPQTTFGRFGSGEDRLDHPFGVTVAGDGQTVWVADTLNDRVSIWTKGGKDWQPQTTFGNQGERQQRLSFPTGTAISADGKFALVADRRNSRIAFWGKEEGGWELLRTFGKLGSGIGELSHPTTVALSENLLTAWVADTDNARISVWSRNGNDWEPAFTFGSRGSGSGQLQEPVGIAVWKDDQTVWVVDSGNHRISVWVKDGDTWRAIEFGGEGSAPDQFRNPSGVAVAPDGQTIWVADRGNQRIAVWTQAGVHSWTSQYTFGSEGQGPDQFRDPMGVSVSANEQTIWVADRGNNRVSAWTVNCRES